MSILVALGDITALRALPACDSQRIINLKSRDDLSSADGVCGAAPHHRGCRTRVPCSRTNAPCSADNPLFISSYAPHGAPWKDVFGGHGSVSSVTDTKLAAPVIPDALWMRLPTAVLLYECSHATASQDPGCTDEAHTYCVVPKHRMVCVRELAPDHSFPVPGFKMGLPPSPPGKELGDVYFFTVQ
eukprot:CAMPEP_0174731542 /NCGR_PEP_ID=MMETSP1094-20130205/57738_1 /TAXON_ID=156173 /ORGANISM="Chrysochromulina brevifilum, Strain UTEX LB 985" /LENGTH=185 /DNA_ID=CAMNT_0015933933 /DNA_START=187 /DNA_END=744 /DNA_ORIENTATION=+